jgi:arabinofuranan 3-O-arabinosyltransferase
VFALWPTFTIVIGSTSAGALPGLMMPWAVLPLVAGLRGQRSLATSCARSGVAVLLMGGVNAVSTISVLVAPALYILTHARGRRRLTAFCFWAVAVAAATAWWLIPLLLQGRYSFNFLPYVEQSATTTQTMSATAFLRGAGNWTAYFNLGAPWLSAGWAMVANPAAILASAAGTAAGLYGIARRNMPERLWACLCVGVACLAMVGYGGSLGGPLHGLVGTLLNGSLAPFRNVSKFEPVVAVALALGLAHAFGRSGLPVLRSARNPRRIVLTTTLAPIVALSLVGLALPYLTGQVLQPGSFTQVPGYWSEAADFLAAHSPNQTALVVPADSHGIYLWGDPIDDPLEPLAKSPWAERTLAPFGGAGSQVFLNTSEAAIESGQDVPGLAAYLQRAGVRYVVVRNDLSPGQLGYTSPAIVAQTLALSGFQRVASFGPLLPDPETNLFAPAQLQAYLPKYPAVEVFQAGSAVDQATSAVAVLPVSQTAFVNGGPDSLLQLEGQGVIGSRPAVIAGDSLTGRPALWAVTDGQRRTDNAFGLINGNVSYTYTAKETNPADDSFGAGGGPPRQILPVPAAGHQTVAVLSGAASVTASSYGSWISYEPQYDPVNAFDGNSATAWTEGNPFTPVGQWIQISFNHALNLPARIRVQLLADNSNRSVANELQVTTAAGRATTTLLPTNATQPLLVPPGRTGWLRITILGASNDVPGDPGAGIRDVLIPGVTVTRYLQPAQATAGTAAPSVAFSFHQSPPAPAGHGNSGATAPIARVFSLAEPSQLELTAAAAAQPSVGLKALLRSLMPVTKSTLQVSASSTWRSQPALGPDNLFTSTQTPWVPNSSTPTVSLSWLGNRPITEIAIKPAPGFAAPTHIEVTSPAGTRQATVGSGGVATLSPPLTTSQLTISFSGWVSPPFSGTGSAGPPLGLAKLTIPALSGLQVGGPAPATPFSLACGQGPPVMLDGQTIQTAVSGTLGDLESGLPVQVQPCTPGGAVSLGGGSHSLFASPGLFTMTDVTLQNPEAGSGGTASARAVTVLSWQPDGRTVRIGRGQESYLEVHQNANAGWVATLNGRPLAPTVLDGWQQAFIVPAGAGGVIKMTFAPSGVYHAGLILSAVAMLGLLAVAVLSGRAGGRRARSRHRASVRPRGLSPRAAAGLFGSGGNLPQTTRAAGPLPHSAGGTGLLADGDGPLPRAVFRAGLLAVIVLIALVGGPVVVAVPVLAVIAALRPRLLPPISLAFMLAAGVIAAVASSPAAIGSGAFGPYAQACALVALAAALYPRRSRQDEDPAPTLATGQPQMPAAPAGGYQLPVADGHGPSWAGRNPLPETDSRRTSGTGPFGPPQAHGLVPPGQHQPPDTGGRW